MSFDQRKVIYGRGTSNNYGTPAGMVQHTYVSADDTQAVITVLGYFSDYLGATQDDVVVGDLLLVRDSADIIGSYRVDTVVPLEVTAVSTDSPGNPFNQSLNTTDSPTFATVTTTGGLLLPTAGGTPTLISFYEEWANQSFQFSGPWNTPINTIIRAVRINEMVTLRINNMSASTTVATFISSDDLIPAELRPSEDSWGILQVVSAGNVAVGKVKVATTGQIQIFSETVNGNFPTPSTSGTSTSSVTYFMQDQ